MGTSGSPLPPGPIRRRRALRDVYRTGMSNLVLEHRDTRFSRRLRRRRTEVALVIAVAEAVLLLAGLVPWWFAVAAAAASVGAYVWVGRSHASPMVRAVTWVAAVSQLIVVLVPVGLVVAGVLVLTLLAAAAAVALAVLLLDRR
jgi:hypothetical protein